MPNKSEVGQRFAFIDYLKIVAVSSVVIAHEFAAERDSFFSKGIFSSDFFNPVRIFLTTGGGGVSLFFIISGFLIAHAARRETVLQFLIRRMFRIYPLYLFTVLIFIISGRVNLSFVHLVGAGSLLGDFVGIDYAIGGVDWTLRLEIVFYAFFFIYLLFVRYYKIRYQSHIIMLFILLVALTMLPKYPTGWTSGYPAIFFPMFIPGVLISTYDRHKKLTIVVIGTVTAFAVSTINMLRFRPDMRQSNFLIYNTSALLIFVIIYLLRGHLRENRVVKWLALLTYPIYLFHIWLLDDIEIFLIRVVSANNTDFISKIIYKSYLEVSLIKAISVLVLLLFCWIASLLIERPLIKFSRAIGNRK